MQRHYKTLYEASTLSHIWVEIVEDFAEMVINVKRGITCPCFLSVFIYFEYMPEPCRAACTEKSQSACFSVSALSASESELSNMFSRETILPRNLEGEKHSSKQKCLCVSYYSWINCRPAAVLSSWLGAGEVLLSLDGPKIITSRRDSLCYVTDWKWGRYFQNLEQQGHKMWPVQCVLLSPLQVMICMCTHAIRAVLYNAKLLLSNSSWSGNTGQTTCNYALLCALCFFYWFSERGAEVTAKRNYS